MAKLVEAGQKLVESSKQKVESIYIFQAGVGKATPTRVLKYLKVKSLFLDLKS